MRESVGSTWLYGIVLAFILLFSAFLSIALHYSRVFKVKNETLSILEKYEGYNSTSREIINNFLKATGYNATGACPREKNGEEYYGESSLNNIGSTISIANAGERYNYCIRKNSRDGYDVVFFFKVDLPIVGDIATIKINGKTKTIRHDSTILK